MTKNPKNILKGIRWLPTSLIQLINSPLWIIESTIPLELLVVRKTKKKKLNLSLNAAGYEIIQQKL